MSAIAPRGKPRGSTGSICRWMPRLIPVIFCFGAKRADARSVPGIDMTTGSLGQGLSCACGAALSAKMDGKKHNVFCVIGDGEMQEGQIWEAAMSCAKYGLDTLTCVLDYNKGQIDGHIKDVMPEEPVADKWRAFNWHVLTIDGHDFEQILEAFAEARKVKGKPTFIIANTVKGKGVSFMEDKAEWHGATPNKDQAAKALAEIL